MFVRVATYLFIFLLIIASGVWVTVSAYFNFQSVGFCPELDKYHAFTILFVMSIVFLVMGFVALFGMCFDSSFLKYGYSAFFLIAFIASIVFAVLLTNEVNDVRAKIGQCQRLQLDSKTHGDNWILKNFQEKKKCCGVTGPQDYSNGVYPSTCCEDTTVTTCTTPHQVGCVTALLNGTVKLGIGMSVFVGALIILNTLVVVGFIFMGRESE